MGEESLNLHDGYPKRERWEGDHDMLGYEIMGEPTPTEPITIHYITEDGVEDTVLGEFMEITAHNSWLKICTQGNWFDLRPDGHVSVSPAESQRESIPLGVADKVVAWEHP